MQYLIFFFEKTLSPPLDQCVLPIQGLWTVATSIRQGRRALIGQAPAVPPLKKEGLIPPCWVSFWVAEEG